MEIWRKIQIANVVLAIVAVILSVAAFYQPNCIYAAMWIWSVSLWVFMFLVPMPIIERNKKNNPIALALVSFLAVDSFVRLLHSAARGSDPALRQKGNARGKALPVWNSYQHALFESSHACRGARTSRL